MEREDGERSQCQALKPSLRSRSALLPDSCRLWPAPPRRTSGGSLLESRQANPLATCPVPTANPKRLTATANRLILLPMSELHRLIWCVLIGLFRSRAALEAEILVLRHQLNVLRRKSPKRLAFGNVDRLVFAGLKPQTVITWTGQSSRLLR